MKNGNNIFFFFLRVNLRCEQKKICVLFINLDLSFLFPFPFFLFFVSNDAILSSFFLSSPSFFSLFFYWCKKIMTKGTNLFCWVLQVSWCVCIAVPSWYRPVIRQSSTCRQVNVFTRVHRKRSSKNWSFRERVTVGKLAPNNHFLFWFRFCFLFFSFHNIEIRLFFFLFLLLSTTTSSSPNYHWGILLIRA